MNENRRFLQRVLCVCVLMCALAVAYVPRSHALPATAPESGLTYGMKLYRAGDYVRAEAVIKRELATARLAKADRAFGLQYLAFVYCRTNRRNECLNTFRQMLAISGGLEIGEPERSDRTIGAVFREAKDQHAPPVAAKPIPPTILAAPPRPVTREVTPPAPPTDRHRAYRRAGPPASAPPPPPESSPPPTIAGAPVPMPVPLPAPATVSATTSRLFHDIRVFFATDREQTSASSPARQFGSTRARDSELTYGICTVSIPTVHKTGDVETPFKLWIVQLPEDPARHVVLKAIGVEQRDAFFAQLNQRAAASPGKSALLFVHGYNVSFADAARRAAQIVDDLQFDGAPVLYSWASKADYAAYAADEESIRLTEPSLRRFVKQLTEQAGIENIYLVAHSMGNRALAGSVAELVKENTGASDAKRTRIRDVVLTAPDINAEIFREQIAGPLLRLGARVTVYASSKDLALEASQQFHKAQRLGDTDPDVMIVKGMDTIDASSVKTDFLGHTYFTDTVLKDLRNMIRFGSDVKDRPGLSRRTSAKGDVYWQLLATR